jgi:TIR domain
MSDNKCSREIKGINAVAAARKALLLGSKRMFERALPLIPSSDSDTTAYLSAEVGSMYRLLNQYHSTIRALTKYALIKDRPFNEYEEERLQIVLHRHVRPLVNISLDLPEKLSAEDCHTVAGELSNRRDAIIKEFMQRVPNEIDIKRAERDKHEGTAAPIRLQLAECKAQSEDFQKEQDALSIRCVSDDHPSLIKVVRRMLHPSSLGGGIVKQAAIKRWDFFISHAGADSQAAKILYETLRLHSRVFSDKECIKYGDDWDTELAHAQKASQITVVLISHKTEAAYYQREEIAAALDMARRDKEGHRVVPIFLSEFDLNEKGIPFGLRLKHSLYISCEDELLGAAHKLLELLHVIKD